MYAPNKNETAFWDALNLLVPASNTYELLMLGDFNGTMDSTLDRSSNTVSQDLPKTFFGLLTTWDLVDVWRELNPTSRDYSFFSHRHLSYSRIDILVSRSLLPKMVNPTIDLRHLSDHASVTLIWRENSKTQRAWQWGLNNYLLEIPGVWKKISLEMQEFFELNKNSSTTQIIWDTLKAYIRGFWSLLKPWHTRPRMHLDFCYCKKLLILKY